MPHLTLSLYATGSSTKNNQIINEEYENEITIVYFQDSQYTAKNKPSTMASIRWLSKEVQWPLISFFWHEKRMECDGISQWWTT